MRTICGLILVATMLAGCASMKSVTSGVFHGKADYKALPADAMLVVAKEIEKGVLEGNRELALEDHDGIVLSGDSVKQAIRTRAARAELVKGLLDSKFAQEDSNGLISIQRSKAYQKATTSKQRDRNALVVMSENNDRWALYEGIVKDSHFQSGALAAVQEIFYKARTESR